jgi:hypothetical protein
MEIFQRIIYRLSIQCKFFPADLHRCERFSIPPIFLPILSLTPIIDVPIITSGASSVHSRIYIRDLLHLHSAFSFHHSEFRDFLAPYPIRIFVDRLFVEAFSSSVNSWTVSPHSIIRHNKFTACRSLGYRLTPDRDIPSMNCFCAIKNTMISGRMLINPPAISTVYFPPWITCCWKNASPTVSVVLGTAGR